VRFTGKTVLITGGAANIGRAAALAFAREGARVMIADLDPFAARDTLADLQEITADCAWVRADVRWEDQVVRMRDATIGAFGRIDVLVNNAALGVTSETIDRITGEDWDLGFSGNVRQMFLCAKHVVPEIARGGGGAVVSTASVQAVIGGTISIAYGPAKAGILNLTRHIAMYYGHRGVRANCICPGHVVTPRTRDLYERDVGLRIKYPIGRLGRIEDVVNAYLFLASEEAAFLTGAVIMVDGGYTVH
jgi:NAD(P)-dependent dehydrogenase (short-subunit alcohol dehydrogenase family)